PVGAARFGVEHVQGAALVAGLDGVLAEGTDDGGDIGDGGFGLGERPDPEGPALGLGPAGSTFHGRTPARWGRLPERPMPGRRRGPHATGGAETAASSGPARPAAPVVPAFRRALGRRASTIL